MKDKMTRGVHYEKIMKILLHIGAGIMLSVFIYRSGEAADSHLAEMTEVEKDVLLNRSNNAINNKKINIMLIMNLKITCALDRVLLYSSPVMSLFSLSLLLNTEYNTEIQTIKTMQTKIILILTPLMISFKLFPCISSAVT